MTIWVPKLESRRPAYLAIADAIAQDIQAGSLPDGTKLPTQRDLARRLEVSIGTVTRAYTEAEARGLVRGEVGRGTFVGGSPEPGFPSQPNDDTSVKYPLDMMWPIDELSPDLATALRSLQQRPDLDALLRYQPNLGMPRHREAGARWIARHGYEVGADRVAVCTGAQHALTLLLSLHARPGEYVLAEELTYPGLRVAAEFAGVKLHGVAVDEHGLIPEALEEACARRRHAKALYTIPTLQNPTTSTLPETRRREIARILDRHEVALFEDAIHYLMHDDPPPPIARFMRGRGYLIASPSKVMAGGLRTAFLAGPKDSMERLAHGVWAANWMTPPLVAEVFATWLDDGTADEIVSRKREESRTRIEFARSILPRDSVQGAATGYHLWVRVPEQWSSAERFADALARRGVAVLPAETFALPGVHVPRAVRISLTATPDKRRIEEGLRRVAQAIGSRPEPGAAVI